MILGILQARSSSTRLPDKVLRPILGRPMLALEIERILRSTRIDRLIVATSREQADDRIDAVAASAGAACSRGSLEDVLDRFYQAALPYRPAHVVRLTGDCPLIDPRVIDDMIGYYLGGGYDYVSNALEPSFPDGLDAEIFSFAALAAAWSESVLPSHREHVTLFINQQPERFSVGSFIGKRDLSHLRWTVDEPEDFDLVRRIYEELYPGNAAFATDDILQLLQRKPELARINARFSRNEGLKKSLEKDRRFSTVKPYR